MSPAIFPTVGINMRIQKLLLPFFALFLFSGCCEYLGICTSASVHTSISGAQQYALQSVSPRVQQLAQQSPESCAR
jgi:hypothetical protein